MAVFKTGMATASSALNSIASRSGNEYQAGIYYIDDTHLGVWCTSGASIHVRGVN